MNIEAIVGLILWGGAMVVMGITLGHLSRPIPERREKPEEVVPPDETLDFVRVVGAKKRAGKRAFNRVPVRYSKDLEVPTYALAKVRKRQLTVVR